jgi:hypothetical protein
MHLVSPSLPLGASPILTGIEWAVEAGWMRSASDLKAWLADQLQHVVRLPPKDVDLGPVVPAKTSDPRGSPLRSSVRPGPDS